MATVGDPVIQKAASDKVILAAQALNAAILHAGEHGVRTEIETIMRSSTRNGEQPFLMVNTYARTGST